MKLLWQNLSFFHVTLFRPKIMHWYQTSPAPCPVFPSPEVPAFLSPRWASCARSLLRRLLSWYSCRYREPFPMRYMCCASLSRNAIRMAMSHKPRWRLSWGPCDCSRLYIFVLFGKCTSFILFPKKNYSLTKVACSTMPMFKRKRSVAA